MVLSQMISEVVYPSPSLQRSRHLRRRPADMSKSLNRTGSFIVRPLEAVFRIGGGGAASEGDDTEVSDGGAEVKDGDAF